MSLVIRNLGLIEYETALARMVEFTDNRDAATPDELWLLEHPPVFTLGLAGDRSHILTPGNIPIVQVDRGGQVTYHGPGQLIAYTLIDLKRAGLGIRDLVTLLEQAVIDTVAEYGIEAASRCDAPGVYVNGAKLGSVGLRIRRGCSYHGVALNVAMDLQPFKQINPCGYADMEMTQLSELGGSDDIAVVTGQLTQKLQAALT